MLDTLLFSLAYVISLNVLLGCIYSFISQLETGERKSYRDYPLDLPGPQQRGQRCLSVNQLGFSTDGALLFKYNFLYAGVPGFKQPAFWLR